MTAHSKLGASSCARWWNCPGSIRLIDSLPKKPESSHYAAEGTAAHALAEKAILNSKEPEYYLYDEIEGFIVDEDMVEAVKVYTDYVAPNITTINGETSGVECQVSLASIDPIMFGTVDAFWTYEILGGGLGLVVVDYKHGAGVPVDAKGNKQMLYYALGIAMKIGLDKISIIQLVVVQPRAAKPVGSKGIKKWTISITDLREFIKGLREAVARTQKPDAPLHAGDHCRFCPAAGVCPEIAKKAVVAAQGQFAKLGDVEVKPRPPEELSPEQIAKILRLAPVIRSWLTAVEEHAARRIETGQKVPGYKLVEKLGNRAWKDTKQVVDELKAAGYTKRDIFDAKIRSVAQMEKLIGKKKFADEFDDLVVRAVTGHTLAKDEDARPAAIGAGGVFDIIPD